MLHRFLIISFFLISNLGFAESEIKQINEQIKHHFIYEIADINTENLTDLIQEVCELQATLIVDNQSLEPLPLKFQENGFITLRIPPEKILERVKNGSKILTAREDNYLVGYLILSHLGEYYFSWMRGADQVDVDLPLDVEGLIQYFIDRKLGLLDQLAVRTEYAKQGIGRQFVTTAKQLSPYGLVTNILNKPFTNRASMAFFAKQGFTRVANVCFFSTPNKVVPRQVYIEMWLP